MFTSSLIVVGTFFGAELENGTFHGAWDPDPRNVLFRESVPTDPEPLDTPAAELTDPAQSEPVPAVSLADDSEIDGADR